MTARPAARVTAEAAAPGVHGRPGGAIIEPYSTSIPPEAASNPS
jgi:hypothetical protein